MKSHVKTLSLALSLSFVLSAAFAQETPKPGAGAARVGQAPVQGADANTLKLITAIRDGNTQRVTALLAAGADVNATDANGSTPLMQACAAASPAVVKQLLDKGANIAAKDKSGFTPLLIAAYSGQPETVQLLLERGASATEADNDGRTALMGAAYSRKEAVVKLLLDKSAPVTPTDKDGFTALMVASGSGNVPLVQMLLDRGADVNAPTRSGFTPLMQACGAGRPQVVSLLLDKGADVDRQAAKGATALLVAAYAGNTDITKLLLDRDAEVNVTDAVGHTPLIGAAYSGNATVARLLLDRGAERDAKTTAGLDALMQAAYSGRLEVARLMLERGAVVDSRTVRGLTPLMQAVGAGNEAVARVLLEHGADVNAVDSSNQTPAVWAKKRGHDELLPFLQKMGAQVDGKIAAPVAVAIPATSPLTKIGVALPSTAATPEIHGPRQVGASPRRPFLYRVPATGKAPLTFAATGLPPGLTLDKTTGLITGSITSAGTSRVTLKVTNASGTDTRPLTVVCGDGKIGLTPPLGWSAWNLYGDNVDAEKVKLQADWLVKTGLAAHGYQYILLDDSWQGRRNTQTGAMTANARLGSIKALADYLHARGLKLGLYASPNAETSGGYVGSEGHEAQDAKTFASWGIDYLKYDWSDNTRGKFAVPAETVTAAFAKMRTALDATNRDVFYAVTPYGFGGVQDWGDAPVRANSWWVNTQVLETWEGVARNGTNLTNGFAQEIKPGHFNDGGWLLVGKVGSATLNPHFTKLTADEQKWQLSVWSMTASPLILSSDLTQLDPNRLYPYTTALLTNDEVLEVNQDPLVKPAQRINAYGRAEVWARPLHDGTIVVGVFNRGDVPQSISLNFDDLLPPAGGAKLTGAQPVRDLWLRRDLGRQTGKYDVTVPRHGAVLLKIGTPKAP